MTPTDNLFWSYLLPILEEQKSESGVVYIQLSDGNGMDRMLEDSASEDVYPGIFVFRPKYSTKLVENHLLAAQFSTQMFVWCKASLDDRESQDAAFQHAERIISAVLMKLQHDMRNYYNYMDFDTVTVEPILYMGNDAAYGYELRFQLGLAANSIFC